MDQKRNFVQKEFTVLLTQLKADEKGKWGKMNAQQMVEHVSDFFKISSGKIHFPVISTPEHLEKLQAFLYSDKEFRENTKAPVLPEDPFPLRCNNFDTAVMELKNEIEDFIHLFENDAGLRTSHPVFGNLNYQEWMMLHYKHTQHHARQFNLL